MFLRSLFSLILVSALTLSCSKKKETAAEEDPDSALGDVGSVIEASISEVESSASAVDGSAISPYFLKSGSVPLAACSYSAARSTCTDTVVTVDWADCSIGSATLSGIITEDYAGFGAAACQLNGDGATLTRSISSDNPRVLALATGALLVNDHSPGTPWDGTALPSENSTLITKHQPGSGSTDSNGLSCTLSAPCFNIQMRGLHKSLISRKGTTVFEQIITSDLTVQGSKTGGDRVAAGTVTVWNETAAYKSVNEFDAVTWGDAACCYPTSGTITSTLTGSVAGSASMTFSAECGEATYTGTDGANTSRTLYQCSP